MILHFPLKPPFRTWLQKAMLKEQLAGLQQQQRKKMTRLRRKGRRHHKCVGSRRT